MLSTEIEKDALDTGLEIRKSVLNAHMTVWRFPVGSWVIGSGVKEKDPGVRHKFGSHQGLQGIYDNETGSDHRGSKDR